MNDLQISGLTFQDRGPYDLSIAPGECVGLSGVSGSGKSLLLRAIADLDPHGGSLRLGDMYCQAVAAPFWRKRVAMLPAESSWWHDRVDAHFSDFSHVPATSLDKLGFDRSVGQWQISRLSTGEKQRLAILRLLANLPGALLLDEPTASLDAQSIALAEDLLLTYCRKQQVPVLWVSHDALQLARVADRQLCMDGKGRLSPQGGYGHECNAAECC